MDQPLKNLGSNYGLKHMTSSKEQIQKEVPSNDMMNEDVTEKFNLAFIPLEGIEDIRYYREKESENEPSDFEINPNYLEKFEDDCNNYFIRGIIYGSQVVLRKLFYGNEEKKDWDAFIKKHGESFNTLHYPSMQENAEKIVKALIEEDKS